MTRVAVVGCGYVGGVSAACLAELGHHVQCIDTDAGRIATYQSGRSPIFEPGLDALIASGIAAGRLEFTDRYPDLIDAEVAVIAVNTPGSQEGAADLRGVRDAIACVAPRLNPGAVIVNKSTVPIGTGELVAGMAERAAGRYVPVVSNPEFLREGSAVRDFLEPDRIVLGSSDHGAMEQVAKLYATLDAPVVRVDIRTAEMIKYASNAFLATKISFINEIAAICDALGADVDHVALGMGLDSRIGRQFLAAGLGWGGSCFPKDVRALAHMAAVHGTHPQLLRSVIDINSNQRLRAVSRLHQALGGLEERRIAILGAAFKPNTDDTRNSPALELAALLALEGAHVTICDPVVSPDVIAGSCPHARHVETAMAAADGADAVVLATAWPEYLALDWAAMARVMARPLVIDTRNALDADSVIAAGCEYRCVGRPAREGNAANATLMLGAAAGG